jgi:hypothetical protein
MWLVQQASIMALKRTRLGSNAPPLAAPLIAAQLSMTDIAPEEGVAAFGATQHPSLACPAASSNRPSADCRARWVCARVDS